MRHQYGQRHVPQQLPGDATEHEFAQARMTVAADNQQIGAHVGSVIQQEIRGRTAGHRPYRLGPDPVAAEVARNISAGGIIGR
jgi:hypothetical protein